MDPTTLLHPILGASAIAIAAWAAALGFEARNRPHRGTRATHRRAGPVTLFAMAAAWTSGVVTTLAYRGDLDAFASTHFRVGSTIVALIALGGFTSIVWRNPRALEIHPWLGAAALLLCGFQIFLGFSLLP